jgi:anti-sigma28 factor (negative regulator of flagellin synthesis)
MRINEISGKNLLPEENSGKRSGKVEDKKDKIEISGEARELYEAKRMEKIEEIRKKIEAGFYDSDSVIDEVVEKIYKLLKLNS